MGTRAQNKRQFAQWEATPDGGRLYWFEVMGRHGWRARYLKTVDAAEVTLRFWQEIYDEAGKLVEIHDEYPTDTGHQKIAMTTRETIAATLRKYLRHEIALDALVDWAEAAMLEGDFEVAHFDAIRNAIARLGVADVRAFGLPWEDCEQILHTLGFTARVEIVAA